MVFSRLLIGALVACGLVTSIHAQGADAAAPADPGASAPAKGPKLEFAKLRSQIVSGDKIGHAEGGFFCLDHGDTHAADNFEGIVSALAMASFKREIKRLGLDDASGEISAFDTGQPSDADYRIGGVVTAMDDRECSYPSGRKGSIALTVKWDIFSTRQQRVVLSKTVSASYALDSFENINGREFFLRGMGKDIAALLTDPQVTALFAGAAPALPPVTLAPIHLPAARPVAGGTQSNATTLKNAVVTIMSDKGSGSGFYIAPGYVLTNRHVVGTAKYVKVKLEDGKELVGEVVREDAPRDVALLKTEPTTMPVLPLRLGDATVGEDVYAIGSPLSQKLSGTFTKGVLSGVRVNEGVRFLQSDVAVNPGNSGGPLLDAAGNALGMTTLKINNTAGLAFFVPMRDAADRLAIVFDAPAAP